MKKLHLFKTILLLCALVVGSTSVWAKSQTITITPSSSFSPALPTSSGDVNTEATAHTVEGLAIVEASIYKSGTSYIMFVKDNGYLYNTTSLGKVTSVAVTYSSQCSTSAKAGVYFGNSVQSTMLTSSNKTIKGQSGTDTWSNSTDGLGYFQLSTSNKNCQIAQIVITFDAPAVSVTDVALPSSIEVMKDKTRTLTPTFTPANATNKNVSWESSNEDIATVDDEGVVTGVALGSATITVTTEDGGFKAECEVTVTDGSIDLAKTGTISFTTFNSDALGSNGYKTQDCYLTASNSKIYIWNETNGYYNNSGWQIKDGGNVTSPIIKSAHGFTVTVAHSNGENVSISDGTNNGTNSLTTTKTSTTLTLSGSGGYTVISGITITPTILNPSDPIDNGNGTITLTTTTNMEGWRAFYNVSQAYTADENTNVFVADTDPVDNTITLKNIGKGIPAGVPVILKTSDAGHNMTLTEGGSTTYTGTNKLAVTDGSNVSEKYRLGYNSTNGVGFYPYSETSPAAGIVYLNVSSADAHALTIDFEEGDVTGITEVSSKKEFNSNIFNLAGQRVDASHKGIVIVNGKKFFNK